MSRLRTLAQFYASGPLRPRFDRHERWYTRLVAADDHEAWLLTWLPGQGTDLHDHGGSAGAFTVRSGRLTEEIPRGGVLLPRAYGPGATRHFGSHHVHRMANAGTVPAVSVHVYSPALTRMTRYSVAGGTLPALAVEPA